MDIKQKLIAVAIAIVLVAFIAVGIETFYKSPVNNCYKEAMPKTFGCEVLQEPNRTSCFIEQQTFYDNQSRINQKCFDEFQPIDNKYKRNVFIILSILGVLSVIIGLFLKTVPAVYLGLMIGGLVNILEGIIRYWSQMNEYFRFIILGALLVILIWISYKKLK